MYSILKPSPPQLTPKDRRCSHDHTHQPTTIAAVVQLQVPGRSEHCAPTPAIAPAATNNAAPAAPAAAIAAAAAITAAVTVRMPCSQSCALDTHYPASASHLVTLVAACCCCCCCCCFWVKRHTATVRIHTPISPTSSALLLLLLRRLPGAIFRFHSSAAARSHAPPTALC